MSESRGSIGTALRMGQSKDFEKRALGPFAPMPGILESLDLRVGALAEGP